MTDSFNQLPGHEGLDDLPFYLVRTAIAFRRVNDSALRQVGLKPQRLGAGSVLHFLFAEKHCTIKTLVERTHLANGTLTGILDGLERDGLIRRVRNLKDGRSWIIQLTAKGARTRPIALRRHKIITELLDSVVSPAESKALKRILQRLTEAMNAHAGRRQNRSR